MHGLPGGVMVRRASLAHHWSYRRTILSERTKASESKGLGLEKENSMVLSREVPVSFLNLARWCNR